MGRIGGERDLAEVFPCMIKFLFRRYIFSASQYSQVPSVLLSSPLRDLGIGRVFMKSIYYRFHVSKHYPT